MEPLRTDQSNPNDRDTLFELFALAKSVRTAQKNYFKSRNALDLEKAKSAEKALDDFLVKFEEGRFQMRIF